MDILSSSSAATTPPTGRPRPGVVAFLALCFAWSWLSLGAARIAGFSLADPVVQLATMALVPAASAALVRAFVTREGFADAGLHPRVRQPVSSYAAALGIPVLVLGLGLLLALTTGLWRPDAAVDLGGVALGAISGIPVAVAASVVFFGEEFGWTAFLRDRLLPGRPVATTFATGLVWGVWHFPLPWVGYFGGDTSVADAVCAMLLWLPLSVLLEFLIGWLWARTGSVWPGAILHAGCNLTVSVGMEDAFGGVVSVTATTLLYCAALVPFVLLAIASGHGRRSTPAGVGASTGAAR